jgi:two-component system sensor kinase
MRERRTLISVVSIVVVGTVLSGLAGWAIHDHEREAILGQFRDDVDEHVHALEVEVEMSLEVLHALKSLHEAAGSIEPSHFRFVARNAIGLHPGIQALEWIPRVTAAERDRFEERAREVVDPDFLISDGPGAPSARRDEHFPVYYVEPLEGNEAALGYDVASDPVRREALELARDTARLHATAPVMLVQEKSEQRGFLVCVPVYRYEPGSAVDRASALSGFMVGVYRIPDIVESGLGNPEGAQIGISIFENEFEEGPPLHHWGIRAGGTGVASDAERRRLDVAGQRWSVLAEPADAFFRERQSFVTYIFFPLGLLLTITTAVCVRVLSRRAQAVARLVDARTKDLRDVNERLEQQRNILQSILDHLGEGVAVADASGQLAMFNPAAEQILGLGQLAVGPDRWAELYGLYKPDTTTPVAIDALPLARAIAGKASRDVELFVRNPERPEGVFINVTATPLKDRQGRSTGGVAVFRDVGERKWAEAVLRDSEARFRAIVEATASALIILSSGHRIREFNPQAERVFGLGRAQALGQDFLELCLPEEYRAAVAADLENVRAGKRTHGFEVPVPSDDAGERTLLWSFSRLTEGNRQEPVVIATGHDITERRQAEESRRVRELAAHLQSARETERTHVAREIHDELGQALTGLKLEVSFLSRKAAHDPQMRERLDGVTHMIDETIGSVRRIAADLRPEILDELGLLEAIRWLAREFERRSRIPCVVELPDSQLEWSAERATAMFRILQEALTNVARHAGARRVEVGVARQEDHVVLEVADDGSGITETQAKGAGSFGLLGIRERARMYGGALRVERREPNGTRLIVTMPL